MRKTRVLHIGCGSISSGWFTAGTSLDDLEYVGLCDINPAAAQSRKAEFVLDCPVFSDTATALKEVRPDVVFDCTIPAAHTPTALLAFEANAHVLSEKPLSDNLQNARNALNAARINGKKYAVTQNYRYGRGPRRLKAFLDSGVLGRITTINAEMFLGPHFGGFRDQMHHVLLLDMSIHTFDMARFLSGAKANWVFCHEWNPLGSWYAHGASANAIFGMTDEILFNFRGSWCATGVPTGFGSQWRIIGERGTVLWDSGLAFQAEVEDGDEGIFHAVKALEVPDDDFGWKERGYAGIMREFLDSVNGGSEAETSAFENFHAFAMVEAAVESATCGEKRTVENL